MTEKTQYRFSVVRSARKTICLEIRPGGTLTVRAPNHASADAISRFVASKSAWIDRNIQSVKPLPPRETPQEEARLRQLAAQQLPPLVERYAKQMGVRPLRVTITAAQKRLGSCSSSRRLCFSYRLMTCPREAVEYIVVHELAHLKQLNHSPAFYRVIEGVLPDWRARRDLIRKDPAQPQEADCTK